MSPIPCPHAGGSAPFAARFRRGFTLVELMVVLVIVALLASLTLAGLSGVRERAKADKTRSTIRKIDSVIQPMFESYVTRRVPATGATPAARAVSRLRNLRVLMSVEMPDNWADVGATTITPSSPFAFARNSVYRRYEAFKASVATHPRFAIYAQAETLMMITSVGGFDPTAMEQFRSDEIGDIDADGAKEFWDGWGRPIVFIRWPAAFDHPFNSFSIPDSLDVMRVSGPPVAPASPVNPLVISRGLLLPPIPPPVSDWNLSPLIFSPGPDEATNDPLGSSSSGYGLDVGAAWLASPINFISVCDGNKSGSAINPAAVTDNITNYELLKK
jgi:prepilin-type N-terminal cleavage/methylation domain-containing protein